MYDCAKYTTRAGKLSSLHTAGSAPDAISGSIRVLASISAYLDEVDYAGQQEDFPARSARQQVLPGPEGLVPRVLYAVHANAIVFADVIIPTYVIIESRR